MQEFIGMETLLARMLIEKKGEPVATSELFRFGADMRQNAILKGMGIVFLTSREDLTAALHDYPDYFMKLYDADNKLRWAGLKDGRTVDDLYEKFIRFLPDGVQWQFDAVMNETKAG